MLVRTPKRRIPKDFACSGTLTEALAADLWRPTSDNATCRGLTCAEVSRRNEERVVFQLKRPDSKDQLQSRHATAKCKHFLLIEC